MKTRIVFACQECGAQSPKWLGRCGECGAWNSFVEESQAPERAAAGAAVAQRYTQAGAAGPHL
jgi:DNA repair protein RadA/Sms